MSKESIFLSLVIPSYNESSVLSSNLSKIIEYFIQKKYSFEIIVVNDGSSDFTAELVRSITVDNPSVKLINNKQNMGKGFSVKSGILSAQGEYILFSDADLSTPIQELSKLLPYFERGFDVVVGSRALKDSNIVLKQAALRQVMGKVFNYLVRFLGLADISDTQCGFKCFKRAPAQRIFSLQKLNGFCFDVEVLSIAKKLSYKIKDVPVVWVNRADSRVRICCDSLRMFRDLFKIKLKMLRGSYDVSK